MDTAEAEAVIQPKRMLDHFSRVAEAAMGLSEVVMPSSCHAQVRTAKLTSPLARSAEGLLAILVPDAPDERLEAELRRLRVAFPGRCYPSLSLRRRPGDQVRL